MMFPLVADLAAEGVPVNLTCEVLGFSTQAFYKWRRRLCSNRDWVDAHTINAILDVHADDPEFGLKTRKVRPCRLMALESRSRLARRRIVGVSKGSIPERDRRHLGLGPEIAARPGGETFG